jgi:hypothetical protein
VTVCDALSFNVTANSKGEDASRKFTSVAYMGDAAHTLDPILAQGAGVAIEDAWLLGRALESHYRYQPYDSFTVSSYGIPDKDPDDTSFLKGNHRVDLKAALKDFETSRGSRIKKLEIFSDLSQAVGHLESPILCRIRDIFLFMIPQFIKGRLFDFSIRAVSTSPFSSSGSS